MDLVLYLDREKAGLQQAAQLFQGARFRVIATASYTTGLRYVRSGSPQAVVLAVYPDSEDWLSVMTSLQSDPVARHIPVIAILSAQGKGLDEKRVRASGVSAVLVRPIEQAALVGKLRELIAKAMRDRKMVTADRLNHIELLNPAPDRTLILFRSHFRKYVLPQMRSILTPEFLKLAAKTWVAMDFRGVPGLDEADVAIIEKLVSLFPNGVGIIAGKHLGTLLEFGQIEDKAFLAFSPEEYEEYLKLQRQKT